MALAASFASADTYDDYPSIMLTNVGRTGCVMGVNDSHNGVASSSDNTGANYQFKLVPTEQMGLFYVYNVGTQTYCATNDCSVQSTFASSVASAAKFSLTVDDDKFLIKNSANDEYLHCDSSNNIVGWFQNGDGSKWTYSLVNSEDAAKMNKMIANNSSVASLAYDVQCAKLKKERILGGAFLYNVSQITSNAKQGGEGSYEALLGDHRVGYPYFHSRYGAKADDQGYHNLMFTFDNEDGCKDFTFTFTPRLNNTSNRPTEIQIFGSTDGGTTWESTSFVTLTEADGLNRYDANNNGSAHFTASKTYNALKFEVHATNTNAAWAQDSEHPFFTYSLVQLWRTDYTPTAQESATAALIQAALDPANAAWADVYTQDSYTSVVAKFATDIRLTSPIFSCENIAKYPTVKFYNYAGPDGETNSNRWMAYKNASSFCVIADKDADATEFKIIPSGSEGKCYIYNVSTDKFLGDINNSDTFLPPVAWDGNVGEFTIYTLNDSRAQTFHNDQPGFQYNDFKYIYINNVSEIKTWSGTHNRSKWYVVSADCEELFATNLTKITELNTLQLQAQNRLASFNNMSAAEQQELNLTDAQKAALSAQLSQAINDAVSALPGDGSDFGQLITALNTACDALGSQPIKLPTSGKLYTIRCTDGRGNLQYNADYESISTSGRHGVSYNSSDVNQQWAIYIDSNDKMYLYNVGGKLFANIYFERPNRNGGASGEKFCWRFSKVPTEITEFNTDGMSFDATEGQGFKIYAAEGKNTTSDAHAGMFIVNGITEAPVPASAGFGTDDNGVGFWLTEVGTVSPELQAEMQTAFEAVASEVTAAKAAYDAVSATAADENVIGHYTSAGFAAYTAAGTAAANASDNDTKHYYYNVGLSAERVSLEHEAVYTLRSSENKHYAVIGGKPEYTDKAAAEGANTHYWQANVSGDKVSFTHTFAKSDNESETIYLEHNGATEFTIEFGEQPGVVTLVGSETPAAKPAMRRAAAGTNDVTFTITKAPGKEATTAIHELSTINNQPSTIYDLQGRKLNAPVKGINIIGGHKVLVK